jgi:hypothetical protein
VTVKVKCKTYQGIYAFEGDRLKICMGDSEGGPRPTKFESPKGGKANLIVLRRVKAKK